MATMFVARSVRRCLMLGIVSMWPAVSVASTSCTSSFQEMKLPDGATLHTVSSSYPKLAARPALDRYAKIAREAGYIVVAEPDYRADSPSLGLGKAPSPNPIAVMVDPSASSISLTTIVAPGGRADAAEERSRLCALVAEFDADLPGAGPRQTAEQVQQASRTALPEPVKSLRVLSPSIPFDLGAAKAALQPGRSVIRGQACGHMKGAMAYASGSKVFLYPATPYWEEVVKLSKKAKPGRDQLVPDPGAVATRMEATANDKGEFQFSQMKPGRYYLVTNVSGVFGGSRDVYAGRVDGTYSSANVYRTENYTFDAASELSEYVDVQNDGDMVKVTLQPPITANPFKRGMTGSILGCRQL